MPLFKIFNRSRQRFGGLRCNSEGGLNLGQLWLQFLALKLLLFDLQELLLLAKPNGFSN